MTEPMDKTADALVVFGITGDLGRRMTMPALYRLERKGALPCDVIGVGRQELTTDELRAIARESVDDAETSVDEDAFDRFAKRLSYIASDATDPSSGERLAEALGAAQRPVFYLATPPSLFAPIVEMLGSAGLTEGARVMIEKPFGDDLASARALNERLLQVVDEDRIYRIDHFLGKEPVQDIVYLRFANEIFEPVWNRNHVKAVQITLAESFGIEGRGSFYDGVGALRDVVQNHLLHVLALVTMEAPAGSRDAIADRRLDVLRAIPAADPAESVRGQYEGYADEDGVASRIRHRDVRRPPPADRQLAMVRRSVPDPGREDDGDDDDRGPRALPETSADPARRPHGAGPTSQPRLDQDREGCGRQHRRPRERRRRAKRRSRCILTSRSRSISPEARAPTSACSVMRCSATPPCSRTRPWSRRCGGSSNHC